MMKYENPDRWVCINYKVHGAETERSRTSTGGGVSPRRRKRKQK
jgi:hypothetical protein